MRIKSTDILFNLALMEELTSHPVDSIIHFRAIVRDKSVSEKDRETARKHIDALAKQTGHIEVTAPSGWNVFVDGASWGTTPLFEPVDVVPGKHKVEVRTPDKRYEMGVDMAAGDTAKASFVDMIMKGGGAPAPATTAPAPSGSAPAADAPAAPTASASADVGVTPPHGSLWTPKNVTVIALGVGAVVAAGIGVGFFMGASSQDDKVSQLKLANPSCAGSTSGGCADLAAAADARTSDRNVGTAFLIGGGALAVGAAATFFLWPKSTTQTAVVPMAGPGVAGLRVMGHF